MYSKVLETHIDSPDSLAYRPVNKLADGADSPETWAVTTDSLWKWSYSGNRDTCSEEAQAMEYLILYAFWQMYVLVKIIQNHMLDPAICCIWISHLYSWCGNTQKKLLTLGEKLPVPF